MLHLVRNPTIPLTVDAALYDGLTPMANEAVNMSCFVMCLDNGFRLDADGQFKLNPTTPDFPVDPYVAYANIYKRSFDTTGWPRGHYRALFRHTSGRDFAYDFTIGIYVNRKLGHAMVYTGTNLKLSVWVEENGDVQSDYVSLTDVKIVDMAGATVAELSDNSSPSEGVFAFDAAVVLSANRHFILKCVATCPGPVGFPTLEFPLMLGMARP